MPATRRARVVLPLVLLPALLAAAPPTPAPAQTAPVAGVQNRTYAGTDANFPNPERGFFRQVTPFWRGKARAPLSARQLRAYRDEGITLVRAYFVIDEFRDAPLSAETLNAIAADFRTVRDAGLKVIPRFAYNFPTNADYRKAADAPVERVLQHISQLSGVLRAYADVIAYVEAGFVGAWGEWHDSSRGLLNRDHTLNRASTAIVDRLLEALPESRAIALRYPYHKQQLFGAAPLAPDQAFHNIPQARVGAHNDCFASNESNGGTYSPPAESGDDVPSLKAYLRADNRFVPQGGETCGTDVGNDVFDQRFVHCESALADLASLRWSALHIAYKREVIDLWRREGCFNEVRTHLGYRFRLLEGAVPDAVRAGDRLRVRLTIVNDGWAAPYNPRGVELVLRHRATGGISRLPVGGDPRTWEPGGVHVVELDAMLPAVITPGDYDVLLNLPDPESSLSARPEYSIRLANEGVWEPATGFNDLLAGVTVTPRPGATPLGAGRIDQRADDRIEIARGR